MSRRRGAPYGVLRCKKQDEVVMACRAGRLAATPRQPPPSIAIFDEIRNNNGPQEPDASKIAKDTPIGRSTRHKMNLT
jgi:hypothetical protein